MIKTKRVYEAYAISDEVRFLVERLWPRGIKKENLVMQAWLKDVSPSPELRQWFQHDPEKWDEFQRRYKNELECNSQSWDPILEALKNDDVTLLYSARDTEKNSANLLKIFLEEWLARNGNLPF
ncbi:MAG: DUF488 family protein [Anaerolineaceae bacterium]|nr:DUF488 family protein [Anaerolineaceae bacterium]